MTLKFLTKKNNWVNLVWKTQENQEQQILYKKLNEIPDKDFGELKLSDITPRTRVIEEQASATNFIDFQVETFKTGSHVAELLLNMTSVSLLYHHHAIVELLYYGKAVVDMHKSVTAPSASKPVTPMDFKGTLKFSTNF